MVFWLSGQLLLAQEQYVVRQTVRSQPEATIVRFPKPVTSLVFSFENWPPAAAIITEKETVFLRRNSDLDRSASDLIVLPEPCREIKLIHVPPGQEVVVQGIYARPLRLPDAMRGARPSGRQCEKPAVVPVSIWRSGLTPPRERPTATAVRFIIVHHEAGSNTATDYVNVARNIYVYHTQSNGWNDVGYNFLIAPDGTIFEGRDGQGLMDGDNVLGAHFCGTNSGTMGICLLGNYMTAQPTTASLESLADLTAWKMKKENLTDPFGSSLHASSGKTLMTISGHRDGICSTECPGTNLYARLPQIREAVRRACPDLLRPVVTGMSTDELSMYPNPVVGGELTIISRQPIVAVQVSDVTGRELSVGLIRQDAQTWRVTMAGAAEIYFVQVRDAGGRVMVRKVVMMP